MYVCAFKALEKLFLGQYGFNSISHTLPQLRRIAFLIQRRFLFSTLHAEEIDRGFVKTYRMQGRVNCFCYST